MGLGFGDGYVAFCYGFADRSVFADTGRIVSTKVNDEAVVIGDVLDVAAENGDAELFHIFLGFFHYLVAEGITVGVDFLQVQSADDFTHVAFKGVLQASGDLVRFHVKKVFGCQLDALRFFVDDDFCYSIDFDVDEVVRRDALGSLDVNRHLSQKENIDTFQDGNLEAADADKDARRLRQTGNDVGYVRRRFDVAGFGGDNAGD